MCIGYKQLNNVTTKNQYLIPMTDDIFDQLQGASFLLKINLLWGYHQLRVKKNCIMKMVFRTQFSHYVLIVMLFSLTYVPATFMDLMNRVFKQYFDIFMIFFINDILIYSQSEMTMLSI